MICNVLIYKGDIINTYLLLYVCIYFILHGVKVCIVQCVGHVVKFWKTKYVVSDMMTDCFNLYQV